MQSPASRDAAERGQELRSLKRPIGERLTSRWTTIKDFESAIAELDAIVKRMEEGDLTLEKSMELYERGLAALALLPLDARGRRAPDRDPQRARRIEGRPGVAGLLGRRATSGERRGGDGERGRSLDAWLDTRRRRCRRALERYRAADRA